MFLAGDSYCKETFRTPYFDITLDSFKIEKGLLSFSIESVKKKVPIYVKFTSIKDPTYHFFLFYKDNIEKCFFSFRKVPFVILNKKRYIIYSSIYNPYHPLERNFLFSYPYILTFETDGFSLSFFVYVTTKNFSRELKQLFENNTLLSHPEGVDMVRSVFSPKLAEYLKYDKMLLDTLLSHPHSRKLMYSRNASEFILSSSNDGCLTREEIKNFIETFKVVPTSQIYPKSAEIFYFLDERIPPFTEFLNDIRKIITPFEKGWMWMLLNNVDSNTFLVLLLDKSCIIIKDNKIIKVFKGYSFKKNIVMKNIPLVIVNFEKNWCFIEKEIPKWVKSVLNVLGLTGDDVRLVKREFIPTEELEVLKKYREIIKKSSLEMEITRNSYLLLKFSKDENSFYNKRNKMFTSLIYANLIDPIARYIVNESLWESKFDIYTIFTLYRHYTTEDSWLRYIVHGMKLEGIYYTISGSYRSKLGHCITRAIASAALSLMINEPVDCYLIYGFDDKNNLLMYHAFCWLPREKILLERSNPIRNILVPCLSPLFYTSDKLEILWEFHSPQRK